MKKGIIILLALIFFTSIYNIIRYLHPKEQWKMMMPPNIAKDPEGGKVTYSLSNNLEGALKITEDGAVYINESVPVKQESIKDVYLIFCDSTNLCDSIRLIRKR